MSTSSSTTFQDVRIGVALKISALWIAMLLLFAYGDIFGTIIPTTRSVVGSCPRLKGRTLHACLALPS